ncbi:MAG: metalloregulator ArsR/SmtB family transcription factor [Bryobacteraceae bacterium]
MQDHLSSTFSALSDPTRRAILARLAVGETSVTELARPFEISMPAVTKHLKVLERAGLISRGREAQWRPCRLEAGPLKDVAGWVEHYRQFWEQSFDRLDEYLRELQTATAAPNASPQKDKQKRRSKKEKSHAPKHIH